MKWLVVRKKRRRRRKRAAMKENVPLMIFIPRVGHKAFPSGTRQDFKGGNDERQILGSIFFHPHPSSSTGCRRENVGYLGGVKSVVVLVVIVVVVVEVGVLGNK